MKNLDRTIRLDQVGNHSLAGAIANFFPEYPPNQLEANITFEIENESPELETNLAILSCRYTFPKVNFTLKQVSPTTGGF